MRILFVFIALTFITSPAFAGGEVISCGIPDEVRVDHEYTEDFCDIYSRQIAYATERKKLVEDIKIRQKSYVAAGNRARAAYSRNLAAYHEAQ